MNTFENDRKMIRLLVDIFIRAYKAKKLGLLFEILVAAFQAKMSWDTAVGRLNDSFYQKEIKGATEKYREENPDLFKVKFDIPGYDKWREENEQKK